MKRKYTFARAVLVRDGTTILAAAVKYGVQLGDRLSTARHQEITGYLATVRTGDTGQNLNAGNIGDLTVAQNQQFKKVLTQFGALRDFASRAFKTDKVKLREQFSVGAPETKKLAEIQLRVATAVAAARQAANAAALTAKGWLAADTNELETLAGSLKTTDETQEEGKRDKVGDTAQLIDAENKLYDGLLDIQGIARKVFAADNPANVTARADFLLNTFPPRNGGKDKPNPDQPNQPTPPTPPAQ